MQIQKLRYQSLLTVVELGTFMSEFNRIFSLPIDEPVIEDRDLLINDVYLGNKGKFFSVAVEAYESCIKRIRKMDQTESITLYNKQRVKYITGCISYIYNCETENDATRVAAAALLKPVAKEFRGCSRLNSTGRTTHISRFIETLRQEKYAEAFATLELDDRISELERVNNLYCTLSNERATELENLPESPTKTRQKCVQAYYDLVELINFALQNNKYYIYDEKATQLEGLTQTVQELVNLRKNKLEAGEEGTAESDQPADENTTEI